MLSYEERKAIENLKIEYEKLMKEDNILFLLYKSNAKRLIDIIEKQSKEIEELKDERKSYAEEYIHNNPWLYKQLNENYILRVESEQKERKAYIKGTNDAHELCNKKWEDKTKAKIEELENYYRELYKQDNSPNEFLIGQDCLSKLSILQEVKQSLLEKE